MTRIGLGFDAHRLVEGRPLVLGGARIPSSTGLEGHSDGDVLSHAIADALLGAAGLGDLGSHFPATEQWRDASSLLILQETARLLPQGAVIGNIDATLIAERPRLEPHRQEMTENIARSLGIEHDAVSVKATTTDGLGVAGRGEGIAAIAVALVMTGGASRDTSH